MSVDVPAFWELHCRTERPTLSTLAIIQSWELVPLCWTAACERLPLWKVITSDKEFLLVAQFGVICLIRDADMFCCPWITYFDLQGTQLISSSLLYIQDPPRPAPGNLWTSKFLETFLAVVKVWSCGQDNCSTAVAWTLQAGWGILHSPTATANVTVCLTVCSWPGQGVCMPWKYIKDALRCCDLVMVETLEIARDPKSSW